MKLSNLKVIHLPIAEVSEPAAVVVSLCSLRSGLA